VKELNKMGKFPSKQIRYFCDDEDCEDDTNDGEGYETLDELEEHQEEEHSPSYTEKEMWVCSTCGQIHEDRDEAYRCCD
jgi:hypothetical protein